MKTAALYSGRSMSQPVLLNELNSRKSIDLHLFRNNAKKDPELDFDHKRYIKKIDGLRLGGKQPLWLNEFLLRKRWKKILKKYLDAEFDLVITMNDLGPPSVEVSDIYGIPSLFFIRNLECSGQEMYSPGRGHVQNFRKADFGGKIQYPFLVKNFNEYRNGLQKATEVIANSEFVSTRLKRDFGVDSKVIYPPIILENYKVEYNENGHIGMVGPRNKLKGGDIFIDIVEQMPSESFISAGNFRLTELKERANTLENLNHMGHVDDMREFYKQTKLVVVPSRWNEAFGRAAAEPMVSGIPCVVSTRGGLPEVVGNTGEIVENIESTKAWIEAIHRALDDPDPKAQMEQAKMFSAEKQGSKLAEIVDSIV